MAQVDDAKRRIVEEIERTRGDLSGATEIVRERLNFSRRFAVAWEKYSWTWMTVAALAGWVLSRLPARKKKIYIEQSGKRARTGKSFSGAVAGKLWSLVWSVARPLVTAYLTRKISQKM